MFQESRLFFTKSALYKYIMVDIHYVMYVYYDLIYQKKNYPAIKKL